MVDLSSFKELGTYLLDSLSYGLSYSSPFHPYYLISALVLSFLWLKVNSTLPLSRSLQSLCLACKVHRHSIGIDARWTLIQLLLLRSPLTLLQIFVFERSYSITYEFGLSFDSSFAMDTFLEGLLATALSMLAIDLAAYALHRALHRFKFLWRVHRFHHQTTFLTPLATLRQHPIESILLGTVRGLAAGLALGSLHTFLPQATPVWTFQGLGIGFFLYMFSVNLHHAPLPIRYPEWLSFLLISPHIHHLHHSSEPRHHDKNFGVVFSLWDRIFGSYCDEKVSWQDLRFGISD